MRALEFLRSHALALPNLAKFAIAMAIIVGVPPLSRRARLPAVVGLLLSGVVLGPHGLDVIGQNRPIADFFAELGKLLLMFFAGLEIDLTRFRQAQRRTMIFGLLTTTFPQVLGTGTGLLLGYGPLAAVVLGSLLASHTLLGGPIVRRLGIVGLEPITITFGATVISDTLSLLVFAVCLATYQSGFTWSVLIVQVVEIAVFVPLILFGLSRLGAHLLGRFEDRENADFILMLGMVAVAGVLAQAINLPGIVGGVSCRTGGQRRGSGDTGEREAGIRREFLLHPDFLHCDRVSDQPAGIRVQHHQQFPLGARHDRGAARREVARCRVCRARFLLFTSRARDDVVAHLAASRRNPRGGTRRLRHLRPGGSTSDRRTDAQRGSGADADHRHSGSSPDRTFRASHACG